MNPLANGDLSMPAPFPPSRSFRTGRPAGLLLWLACAIVALAASPPAAAQQWQPNYDLRLRPDGPGLDSIPKPDGPEAALFDGPASPDARASWLSGLKAWREERKKAIGYRDDLYRQGGLDWARRIFTQAQLLGWDRSLYDPVRGEYTPDRALAGLTARFGPIDSVLIWPAYPNLGLDGRDQFDLVRDLPGGVPALRKLVADFHRRGVRVFFPVLDWDGGTRDAGRVARQRGGRHPARHRRRRDQFRHAERRAGRGQHPRGRGRAAFGA